MSAYAQAAAAMHGPRIFCRGCRGDVMSRSDEAYCRDCQVIRDECVAAREARLRQHRPIQRDPTPAGGASFYDRRHRRVGIGNGYAGDYDGFSEVDWQDAMHPNEGSL